MTERKLEFFVYKHTCVTTNKSYIGVTQNMQRRIRGHRSPSSQCVLLRNAVQKYGWDSFVTNVLATSSTLEEALALEQRFIAEHQTLSPTGYNLKTSGTAIVYSEETKQRISSSLRGRTLSPEWRAKISASLTGRKATLEKRANMSKALRGKPKPPRTEEHKAKVAEANRRKALDPKWREKMSQAHKQRQDQVQS